jgi:hypothetical protein
MVVLMSNPTAEKKGQQGPETKAVKKGRSPAYPSVALDKAIELVRKVWDTQRKQEAHVDATLLAMGYTSQSGASLRALSALRQYGLIQDSGDMNMPKIKVTECAQDVILLPDSDSRKLKALRAAALSPSINAALWELYGAHLPSDESIIAYLARDKGYHQEAAVDVITNYRNSFSLAKLDKFDDIKLGSDKPNTNTSKGNSNDTHQMIADTQEMPLSIGPNMVARIPFPLSEDDFKFLLDALNLYKKKLVSRPVPAENTLTDAPLGTVLKRVLDEKG